MLTLPLPLMILAWLLTVLVTFLAFLFWRSPEKGMAFATHRDAQLPQVMVNRYVIIALFMGGALYTADPGIIAFAFFATGIGPAHDAWIYYRAGQPFQKHLPPAILSAVVAVWSFILYTNSGAV